ncbi:MAG: hypothetical protein ACLS5G_01440 [Streptococcus sp.]
MLESIDGSVHSILKTQKQSFIVHVTLSVKLVEDEFEGGVRMYLNFGHTIGHAVEQTAGYSKVMHGEAVAIGMVQFHVLLRKKV